MQSKKFLLFPSKFYKLSLISENVLFFKKGNCDGACDSGTIKQKIIHIDGLQKQWRRQASEFGGGGHLRGKLIFWGGQDRIFKKVLLFAHAVVAGLLPPSPGDSLPSQKGAIFLGISPPPL
jgi:hypothetical protein